MKYENARDILPEELFAEVQKYAAGKLLYFPAGDDKRGWGEASGYRDQLLKRNRMIRNKYAHGITVSELADEYFLSLDSIKKIIYSKKTPNNLAYYPTVASAVQYAGVGLIEEWIQCYLLFSSKEGSECQDILEGEPLFFGVVKLPLRLIQPIESGCADRSEECDKDSLSQQSPLLVQYEAGKFYCTVQQELFSLLKRCRVNAYPSIITLKGSADYRRYNNHFGNVFFYVKE
ncbi:CD3324 family protein [Paenibacillus sp. CAU 1782]